MLDRTPAQRALAMPELLDLILSFGDKKLHAKSILVNRQWSAAAAGHLYREIEELVPILRILCPLKPVDEPLSNPEWPPGTEWEFVAPPTSAQWTHFMKYARFVRSLAYLGPRYETDRLSARAFTDLAVTRTAHRIFPNLRSLHWSHDGTAGLAHEEVCFVHEGLQELRIEFEPEPHVRDVAAFMENIAGRTPNLTYICLQPLLNAHTYTPLIPAVASLRRLTTVTLSRWFLSNDVLVCLSTLPDLECIQFLPEGDAEHLWGAHHTTNYPSTLAPLPDDAFPSLCDLSLCCPVEQALDVLCASARSALPKLTHIYVHSVYPERPPEVHELLSGLSARFPALISLALDVIMHVDKAHRAALEPLAFEHLRPLLQLSELRELDIRHNLPIRLSAPDLVELGDALPRLHSLVLNSAHFPLLSELGLHLDAARGAETWRNPPPTSTRRFRALRALNFGTSPIAAETLPAAQLYLSHLFADCDTGAPCVLSGFTWEDELWIADSALAEAVGAYGIAWRTVGVVLPMLVALRKDERRAREALLAEVEDLRMRSGVLERMSKDAAKVETCTIM